MSAIIILTLALAIAGSSVRAFDRGTSAFTADIIKARGFVGELHVLTTRGGIPITIHRIINPLANSKTLNKYPVLYGHGFLFDSQSMISRSEHTRARKPTVGRATINYGNPSDGSDDMSLPFMYSNNNFDVWLFDSRGTNDGNRNASTELNFKTAQKYWDFCLDDQALVDLPLIIDYVLEQTASPKLVYTGFSESTLFMFALQSTRPEYADKVVAFVALAPVAYVANIRGLTLPTLAGIASWTPEFIAFTAVPQPIIDTVDTSLRNFCTDKSMSAVFCAPVVNGIGGQGTGENSPTFFNNFFKSTSMRAVKHFLQLYVRKVFSMYDYGESSNLRIYGQTSPPLYDLGRVRQNGIILVRGLNDFLSDPKDQERLIRELGTKPYLDIVVPQYNHFDVIDGKDLIKIVNGPVLAAVFDLMYKDSPKGIIRTPEQNAQAKINRNIALKTHNLHIQEDIAPTVGTGQKGNLGLFELPTEVVRQLTGGSGIFNEKFLVSALGRK